MRLIIWNIHKGIGARDRHYAPGRIASVLGHYQPDVVLLQEVDDGAPRSGRDPQAQMLAEALEMPHVAFGPNVKLKVGRYGNATLSRHPIAEHRNVDLTLPMKKRRGALYTKLHAQVRGHRYSVHLFNIHLGLAGMERRWQTKKLVDRVPLSGLRRGSRVIVAGDTNDWAGALPYGSLGRDGFRCVTGIGAKAIRTFPSWKPVGALDKIFLRGPVSTHHVFRSRMALAREASDHIPIIVDLDLGAT